MINKFRTKRLHRALAMLMGYEALFDKWYTYMSQETYEYYYSQVEKWEKIAAKRQLVIDRKNAL